MPVEFFGAGVWHTNGARGMQKSYLIEWPLSANPLEISSELVLLMLADYEAVRPFLADAFKVIERELIPSLKMFEQCLFGDNLPAFYAYTCKGIYLDNQQPSFLKADYSFIAGYLAKIDAIEEHIYVFQAHDIAQLGKVADFFSRAKAEYTDSQIAAISGIARTWQALNLYFDAIRKAYAALSSPLTPDAALKLAVTIANAYAARALEYSEILKASGMQFKDATTGQSTGGVKAAKAKAATNEARNSKMVLRYFEESESERHNLAGKLSQLAFADGSKLTTKGIWKIWKQYGIKQGQSNAELVQRYSSYARYRRLPVIKVLA